MAPKIMSGQPLKRQAKVLREYFYPGEVARILELEGLDYQQLRRIFRLIYASEALGRTETEGRWAWARFTFRDLVAIRTVISLAGGGEALRVGKRLRLGQVETACRSLREKFGLAEPIRQVALARVGTKVVAKVQGVWLEPLSGQLLLDQAEQVAQAVNRYLECEARFTGELKRFLQKTVDSERERLEEVEDPFAVVFTLGMGD